jgi:3-hydroxyisobutyrate dehydrogenase-like beta-hydroxyacid dehydrogenase
MKNTNGKKIGILGFGEIGKAIARFYQNPRLRRRFGGQAKIKDLNRDDGLKGVEILHICIPWDKNFVKVVEKEIKDINPKLVIIHSTVAPGTTKKLALGLQGGIKKNIVHSPVRGVHPDLYGGIKTFIKYIGADNKNAAESAKRHMEKLGIKTKIFYPSVATEIGKILDTTYYGLCIAWHGEMKKICDKFGISFKDAVSGFNATYNEGYLKLGKKNVIRPVLSPPERGIGGHCIIPNAEILKKYFKSKALDLILEYKGRPKKR